MPEETADSHLGNLSHLGDCFEIPIMCIIHCLLPSPLRLRTCRILLEYHFLSWFYVSRDLRKFGCMQNDFHKT